MGGIGLAFVAGLLSTLSPCVLPLIPVVVGTALNEHRLGPFALASGLALSFVGIGLFVAAIGFASGLDQELFRSFAAILMVVVGVVMLIPKLQRGIAAAAGPFGNWAQARNDGLPKRGLGGQFAVGIILGAVWSPCVGPTLGAAFVLAAHAESLPLVALTMFAFGIGATLPLLAIGLVSRDLLSRWRHRLLAVGTGGRSLMGALLIVTGIFILSGSDKRVEEVLVEASPPWLTNLTTRF